MLMADSCLLERDNKFSMETITNEPYKTTISALELPGFVNKESGLSDWSAVTQEDINTFAKITDDEQWIHIDEERAKKESPYGTTIAHGFMILSLASKFCYEAISIDDIKTGFNYGFSDHSTDVFQIQKWTYQG